MRAWFIVLYILVTAAVILTARDPYLQEYYLYTKPLLMLSLMACVTMKRLQMGRLFWPLMGALVFSLVGDVLLLPHTGEQYFILGLLSFLSAHILYIILFLRTPPAPLEVPFIRRYPWVIFLVIVYGLWMFTKVRPGAGEIAWAVLIYILVILTMLLSALNREGKVIRASSLSVSVGAVLFAVSDSVLAWNRFVEPVSEPEIWILSTYAVAQLLIVRGLMIQGEE